MLGFESCHQGEVHLAPVAPPLVAHQVQDSHDVVVAVVAEKVVVRAAELLVCLVN